MIAATIISSLLLMAGGAPADASGPPDLREYPIEIGDPWDMGGGGSFKLKQCRVEQRHDKDGTYWVITYYWGSSPTGRKECGRYTSLEAAESDKATLCES